MRVFRFKLAAGAAALLLLSAPSLAQQVPSNPGSNPQSKQGANIVINPTVQECERGWNSNSRWTKEQFEQFCATLGKAK
jgi:hypothetical protein